MVPLIAQMRFAYAGRMLSVNDPFEASESDAHILKLLQRAIDAEPAKPKRQYRRRDLQAQS